MGLVSPLFCFFGCFFRIPFLLTVRGFGAFFLPVRMDVCRVWEILPFAFRMKNLRVLPIHCRHALGPSQKGRRMALRVWCTAVANAVFPKKRIMANTWMVFKHSIFCVINHHEPLFNIIHQGKTTSTTHVGMTKLVYFEMFTNPFFGWWL